MSNDNLKKALEDLRDELAKYAVTMIGVYDLIGEIEHGATVHFALKRFSGKQICLDLLSGQKTSKDAKFYIMCIIKNYLRTEAKVRGRFVPPDTISLDSNVPHSDDIQQDSAEVDNKARVRECIKKTNLTDEEKLCVELFYFQKLKYEDIAQQLGITTNRVGTVLYSARDKLRKVL